MYTTCIIAYSLTLLSRMTSMGLSLRNWSTPRSILYLPPDLKVMEATASPHWSLGHLPNYDPLPTYQLLRPAIPDTPTKPLCFLESVCTSHYSGCPSSACNIIVLISFLPHLNTISFYSLFVILSQVFVLTDLGVIIVVAAIRWNICIIFPQTVRALLLNTS